MAEGFDPYYKWLGIPPKYQPPHHYRLLGIELYEDDPEVIEAAAERHVSYLRDAATGEYVKQSQELLNEIAAARLCLLNPDSKHNYDRDLRKSLAAAKAKSAQHKAPQPSPKKSAVPTRKHPPQSSQPPAEGAKGVPSAPPLVGIPTAPVVLPKAQPIPAAIPTAAKVVADPPVGVTVTPDAGPARGTASQLAPATPAMAGLSASHEQSGSAAARAQARREAANGSHKILLLAGGGTVVVVLMVVIAFTLFGSKSKDSDPENSAAAKKDQDGKSPGSAQADAWQPSRTAMPAASASFPRKNLVFWIDIANRDSLEVDPNENVRQIWDVSGNSLASALSSPSRSPKLVASPPAARIRFGNQGEVIQFRHSPALDLKAGFTIVTVAQGSRGILVTKGLDQNGFAIAFDQADVVFQMKPAGGSILNTNGDTPHRLAVRTVVGDSKGVTWFVDGKEAGKHNKKHTINTDRTLTIGRSPSRDNSDPFQGELGEILIFNTALSARDRGAVEQYLTRKWLGR